MVLAAVVYTKGIAIMKKILKNIGGFLYTVACSWGRSRAAAYHSRQGNYALARKIMSMDCRC
jgi:hypothetical protein